MELCCRVHRCSQANAADDGPSWLRESTSVEPRTMRTLLIDRLRDFWRPSIGAEVKMSEERFTRAERNHQP